MSTSAGRVAPTTTQLVVDVDGRTARLAAAALVSAIRRTSDPVDAERLTDLAEALSRHLAPRRP